MWKQSGTKKIFRGNKLESKDQLMKAICNQKDTSLKAIWNQKD